VLAKRILHIQQQNSGLLRSDLERLGPGGKANFTLAG